MKENRSLTRCEKGHFYDGNRFDTCPHCSEVSILIDPTVMDFKKDPRANLPKPEVLNAEPAQKKTAEKTVVPEAAPAEAVAPQEPKAPKNETVFLSGNNAATDDSVTIHFYKKALGTKPVVGWVVCVDGYHKGEDFRIQSGRNFIGRNPNMDVPLSGDTTVSRERHAIITYDPKGNTFFVQPGDSSELTYLNDAPLLTVSTLKAKDKITVGQSELVFIPFCDENFIWKK